MDKKDMKKDWYSVSTVLVLITYLGVNSWAAWPFLIEVLISGKTILAQCAVVLTIALIGLVILSSLIELVQQIEIIVERKLRSHSDDTPFLKVDMTDEKTRKGEIQRLKEGTLMIMYVMFLNWDALLALSLSPNFEGHDSISKYDMMINAFLFSTCLIFAYAVVLPLFGGVEIIVRLWCTRHSTASDDLLVTLMEKRDGVLAQVFLVLNMIIWWLHTTYITWPIHMKHEIFTAYFLSFFGLLVIIELVDLIVRRKRVESHDSNIV